VESTHRDIELKHVPNPADDLRFRRLPGYVDNDSARLATDA
jgi:hypothetical protein